MIDTVNEVTETESSWYDAFVGPVTSIATSAVTAYVTESAKEELEPANQANGNTEALYQATTGTDSAGQTVVTSDSSVNYAKVGLYTGAGICFLIAGAIIYKVVK